MGAIDRDLYSTFVTSLVGKVAGYAAQKTFNVSFPYTAEKQNTESGSNYQAYYEDQTNNKEAKFLQLNTESSLGLLAAPPQWHGGGGIATIAGTDYPNKYPAIPTEGSSSYSFIEVREIPNNAHNGYFVNADGGTRDYNKFFDGLYWNSYQRYRLFKRLPDINLSTSRITRGGIVYDKFDVTASDFAVDVLQYKSVWTLNDAGNEQEYQVSVYNPNSIYMGENTNSVSWPTVKYFGLFKSINQPLSMVINKDLTSQQWMGDPNLYYWGEFEENNKWYHAWTYVQEEWPIKRSSLYEYNTLTNTYFLTEDTEYDDSKTYYEKLGIIVEPGQGGVFSKNQFKLKWNSDILSNAYA